MYMLHIYANEWDVIRLELQTHTQIATFFFLSSFEPKKVKRWPFLDKAKNSPVVVRKSAYDHVFAKRHFFAGNEEVHFVSSWNFLSRAKEMCHGIEGHMKWSHVLFTQMTN